MNSISIIFLDSWFCHHGKPSNPIRPVCLSNGFIGERKRRERKENGERERIIEKNGERQRKREGNGKGERKVESKK